MFTQLVKILPVWSLEVSITVHASSPFDPVLTTPIHFIASALISVRSVLLLTHAYFSEVLPAFEVSNRMLCAS
jgi:hypothetical protein